MKSVKKLTVLYNGTTVGYLAEFGGKIGFQYDGEWVKSGFTISPFSLPLKGGIFVSPKDVFGGLYGVFADSLPDGWGELLVKRTLAKRGVNYDKLSPLTKLSLISGEGLGALEYVPNQGEMSGREAVDFDRLAEDIRAVLDDGDGEKLDEVYALGGSSGGARPKAHVKIDGEEWIVKFPCRIDPSDIGVKEYSANVAAKKCGLDVNEFRLFPSGICGGYFGCKRFDRSGKRRVHTVSLSSLLETTHRIPNLDYTHFLQVTQRICEDDGDVYEAYGRMCFNVFYGNRDDHGKNFSFIFDEKRNGYALSPFYDITATPEKSEHEMTVYGAGKPTEADLLRLCNAMDLSSEKCVKILERIKNTL